MCKRKLDHFSETSGMLPSREPKRAMTCAPNGDGHESKCDDDNNTDFKGDESRLANGIDFPAHLPCDITWDIFARLSFFERIKCMQVSKSWYAFLAGWSGMWEDIYISLPESVQDGWQKAIPEPETGHVIKHFTFFGNTVQMKKTFDTLRERNHCRIQTMGNENGKEVREEKDRELLTSPSPASLLSVIGSIYAWDTVDISSAEQISTLGNLLELTGQSLTSLEFRDAIFSADMLMDKILLTCKNLRTLICKIENDQPTAPTWTPSPSIEATWITELIWSAEVVLPLDRFLPLCRRLELLVIDSAELDLSDSHRHVLRRIDTLCPSLRHIYCLDSDTISSLEIADLRRNPRVDPVTEKPGLQSISLSNMESLKDTDLASLLERNHHTLELLSITHFQPLSMYWSVLATCGARCLKKLCLKHPGPPQFLNQAIEQCPALEDVVLSHCCSNVTFLALSKLKYLRSVVVLSNDECNNITDGVLAFAETFAASSSLLEKVHIRSVFVTDSALEALGKIKSLKSVHLGGCTRLTKTGLLAFIESLEVNTRIESINLAGLDAVTDEVVLALGQRLDYIRDLDLSRCCYISDNSVLGLIRKKKLRQLLLKDCLKITYATHTRVEKALGMEHHIVVAP